MDVPRTFFDLLGQLAANEARGAFAKDTWPTDEQLAGLVAAVKPYNFFLEGCLPILAVVGVIIGVVVYLWSRYHQH